MAETYVYRLETLERFKGDTFSIIFSFYDDDGEPINLNECTPVMTICPYGKYQDEAVLTKVMSVDVDNNYIATASFIAEDTIYLDGNKFSYQPILVYDDTVQGSPRRREFRRAEGDLILFSRISPDETQY